ncbi:type IV pili methyl-accepting chemotaxis transducer N-terminal domain-containing protein [Polaromonas hydrogenivorans]
MFSHSRNCQLPYPPRRLALKACVSSGALLYGFGFSATAWAQQPLAISTAINRAGRLRALSQRTVKAYAQLVLGVEPEQSQDVLTTAQRIVKTYLNELGRAGFSAETAGLLAVCQADADRLAGLVAGTPAASRLSEANKAADQMLASAERLTEAIESRTKGSARIVNIAGRQRMLSQKMAKSFMLAEAGVDAEAMRKQLDAARSEFVLALDSLEAAPVSTPAIKQGLAQVRLQWVMYEIGLNAREKLVARRNVATTSERILEVMDNLTGLYEAALKELLGTVSYNEIRFAGLYPAS